jgi:integrase
VPKRAKERSAREIAALKTDGRYAVGGVIGLYLQVVGSSRSWILRIKIEERRRDFGLGSYPEVSLADARERAWELRRGNNWQRWSIRVPETLTAPAPAPPFAWPMLPAKPAGVALAPALLLPPQIEVPTFATCAKTYIGQQQSGWKSGKHADQWRSTLESYAYPIMGDLPIDRIKAEHILKILQPIWEAKTETATRVRGRIESILDWATHKKFRSGENPAAWNGNLEHELPSPTKLKKRKKRHHPALPYMRIGSFMADLRSREGISIQALEWGILTATRSQEIRCARHAEIDLQLRRWNIPAGRMKAEKDHIVPLSDAAIALYGRLPRSCGCDLLFPAPEGGELSYAALGQLISGMHEADIQRGGAGYLDVKQNRIATPHGFRSTFRDWAAEVIFFPRDIIEHALAHKIKDEAEAAYQRGTMLVKRALLMERWAQFCDNPSPQVPEGFKAGDVEGLDANIRPKAGN